MTRIELSLDGQVISSWLVDENGRTVDPAALEPRHETN
jgi:hypothetical protein